jgi:flavin-dependent dehydrogenase
MASVCVMGGGPAGSTFAARMAQLGHDVELIESVAFPRPRIGESLSPGVLPLLETTGAGQAVEAAGFRPVCKVMVMWDGPMRIRANDSGQGLLVDRGRFDHLLLARAKQLGVRILQPARIVERCRHDDAWTITVEMEGRILKLRADFLADARGRASSGVWRRQISGPSTLALYAYWRGIHLPEDPRIAAGGDAWYWGVPLPDGGYNTLVFVDTKQFHADRDGTLMARFLRHLDQSGLMAGTRDAKLAGPVRAIDATPYVVTAPVTPASIAVGEAALALDPISSSGVQKAIQSALAGAVVANTLLSTLSSAAAMAFYAKSLSEASTRHRSWAMSHYAAAAVHRQTEFWQQRAAPETESISALPQTAADAKALTSRCVELSAELVIEELPCIEGEFVVLKPAVRHPGLAAPVAYLSGEALVPLIGQIEAGSTPLQIARKWSAGMPLKSALSIAIWLLNAGILVERGRTPVRN